MLDYENLVALVGEWDEDEHKEFIELKESYDFDDHLGNEDREFIYLFYKNKIKEFIKHFKGYEHLYENNLYSICPMFLTSIEDLIENEIDDSDCLQDYSYKWFKDDLKETNKENEYYETLKKLQSIVNDIVQERVLYDCEYKNLKVEDLLKEVEEK